MADTTEPKHNGGPFRPGDSRINRRGRPIGSRHKTTLAAEALFDNEAEIISRKCIEAAKAGDSVALRLALDRILPARRERPVKFRLGRLETAQDAAAATAAIVTAVADGDLTPGEAEQLARLVETFVKTLEAADFQQRLERLEAAAQSKEAGL